MKCTSNHNIWQSQVPHNESNHATCWFQNSHIAFGNPFTLLLLFFCFHHLIKNGSSLRIPMILFLSQRKSLAHVNLHFLFLLMWNYFNLLCISFKSHAKLTIHLFFSIFCWGIRAAKLFFYPAEYKQKQTTNMLISVSHSSSWYKHIISLHRWEIKGTHLFIFLLS